MFNSAAPINGDMDFETESDIAQYTYKYNIFFKFERRRVWNLLNDPLWNWQERERAKLAALTI